MAITANVDLGNGVTASSCYIIVPTAYVKKTEQSTFILIYDVHIYQNKEARDHVDRLLKHIRCKEVDHFKIDYDLDATDNPFKLAYAHLKTNDKLSSISDV